jgi:hypothetical protein
MSKPQIKHNAKVQQILEDLDNFREFVASYGYRLTKQTCITLKVMHGSNTPNTHRVSTQRTCGKKMPADLAV